MKQKNIFKKEVSVGARKLASLFLVFATLLTLSSPLTAGAAIDTNILHLVAPQGSAPTLEHFSIGIGDNGKGTVSVQITNIGDKAKSISSCSFSSTRPTINTTLTVTEPDTTHPEMRYCSGSVDFGKNAPYLPSVTIKVTNDLDLATTFTTPEQIAVPPKISSVTLNGTEQNEITISDNYEGNINVVATIADIAGAKDCKVSLSDQTATVGAVTTTYEDCSFDLSQIKGSLTATLIVTDLLDIPSLPYTFKVIQEAAEVVTPPTPTPVSTKPAHLLADYSVTKGKVVVPEKITPDTAQAKNLTTASVSFWLGILLLVTSFGYFIFLIWKKRKKQYWPQYAITGVVFIVGIASITYTRLSLAASKPEFIRHATFSSAAIPATKTVATELANPQGKKEFKKTDSSKPTVGESEVQASANTPDQLKPFTKYPEYITHFGQFVASVNDANTSLKLATKVAESTDAPVWGLESAVTEATDYIKSFQLTSEGKAPGDLTVEVSTFPFPGQNCTQSTALYSTTISAKDKETLFNLDFKKIIPAGYLNGKQTGTLPFNVRVVKAGSKENCNELVSNAVSTSAVFILTSETVTYPDGAVKNVLYTTGTGQRTGGEFPNTEDVSFLNWHLENQDYRFVMDEGATGGYPSFGRWQVALSPFDDTQCLGPENQIAYADVDLTDKKPRQLAFDIDFAKIAINKPTSKGTKSNFEETKPAAWKNIPLKWVVKTDPNATPTTLEEQLAKSKDPVAYYVRFVALNAGAGTCNTNFKPTNTVTINYGEQKESKPVTFPNNVQHSVTVDASISLSSVKYTPPRQDIDSFNPEGHYYWLRDFPGGGLPVVVHAGEKLYVPPVQPEKDKSFLDSVGDFVSSIGDFITSVGNLISAVADAYNGIKSSVVDGIASGLTAVGIPCDSTCKAGLSAGISIAQAAIGVPPSLPNFDQLMDQGIDYVAAAAADQVADGAGTVVSAATEQATKAGLTKMKDELKKSRDEANQSSPSPIAPDLDYMYKPGSISVVVKNFGNTPARGNLVIHFHDTNAFNGLDLKDRELFKPAVISVPSLQAGQSMTIPIQLQENYDDYRSYEGDVPPGYTCTSKSGSCAGIVSDPEYALAQRKARWFKVYNEMQIHMTVFAGAPIKLPSDFKPENIGIDASGWTLKPGGGATTKTWFDEPNNTNHVFAAKPQGGQSLNLTFSPHTSYSN